MNFQFQMVKYNIKKTLSHIKKVNIRFLKNINKKVLFVLANIIFLVFGFYINSFMQYITEIQLSNEEKNISIQLSKAAKDKDWGEYDKLLINLKNSSNFKKLEDLYWLAMGIFSSNNPYATTIDPDYCFKQINPNSKYYMNSIICSLQNIGINTKDIKERHKKISELADKVKIDGKDKYLYYFLKGITFEPDNYNALTDIVNDYPYTNNVLHGVVREAEILDAEYQLKSEIVEQQYTILKAYIALHNKDENTFKNCMSILKNNWMISESAIKENDVLYESFFSCSKYADYLAGLYKYLEEYYQEMQGVNQK